MLDVLLAQSDLGQAFSRYTQRSNSPSDTWLWAAVVLGVAGLWLGLYYWDRFRRRTAGPPPSGGSLFQDLCRAHGLTRAEQALLVRAMNARPQIPPAAVFVQPELLAERAGSRDPEAGQFQALAEKLFGRAAPR